ncbi:MAG: cyclic nucleotide-binding domain-containing protein [Verrucomicrobiia bacterium]|jgi:class 3 adenylate cyclase/CRP-like cAMP-binding protein
MADEEKKQIKFDGACAVLGLDIVGFSRMKDEDQVNAIQHLYRWITEALANHSITHDLYRWSPAGDGGFLTFNSTRTCQKAIDVAFTICGKVRMPDWRPTTGDKLRLRLGLHAGMVTEEDDLGWKTNVWGVGINTADRILAVSAADQLLVSKQYFDNYIQAQRKADFDIGEMHWRTVKHGVGVEVMNVNRHDLCLNQTEAENRRWQAVGGLWQKTIQNYTYLIHDAMKSGDPVAALACAKFLLELKAKDPVRELCHMIGRSEIKPSKDYPPQTHILFSQMPPDLLFKVIEQSEPRLFTTGEILFKTGDSANSCFFPVSGTIVLELPDHQEPIPIPKGQMAGEFSLWIPNISRTGSVHALDDGLVLEIPNDKFKAFIDDVPDVANVIYGIIRKRIAENVLTSHKLFPDFLNRHTEDLASFPAVCQKHAAGTELDLTNTVHVLFSGAVEIAPEDGVKIEVEGQASFGSEVVVGIISEIGEPDGASAKVIVDAVAVSIPHDALQKLQDESELTQNAWNAICGQRLGQIRRAKKKPGES